MRIISFNATHNIVHPDEEANKFALNGSTIKLISHTRWVVDNKREREKYLQLIYNNTELYMGKSFCDGILCTDTCQLNERKEGKQKIIIDLINIDITLRSSISPNVG